MRYLLVLAFVAVAYAGAVLPDHGLFGRSMSTKFFNSINLEDLKDNNGEIDLVTAAEEGTIAAAPSISIISWQFRRALRKMQKQMPCGWAKYGIPPLAPLKKQEVQINFKQDILETITELTRLSVTGLDNFQIIKLKVNIWTSKVTFDFLFSNIQMSAQKYETDTLIDAMEKLGLTVQYKGDGSLDLNLINVRVAGTLKYKIPKLWGSSRITSMKTDMTVESVKSSITGSGIFGVGVINGLVNNNVEKFIESRINDNRAKNSDLIENNLVPKVNQQLKGTDFWTLVDLIFSSVEDENEDDPIVTKCVAPEDPWN